MDENSPLQAPCSHPLAFGNPWHGSIVNSTLTLPDASTRMVPIPLTNDVFDFHVPGAAGGGSAPAPAGGIWRDYLLLYGTCNSVYGEAVSSWPVNWLFARSDGSRWLVSVTSAVTGIALSNAALVVDFSATRFGEFGGTGETIAFSLTLADRGLGNTLPAEITEALPASVSIGISDIASRGQKCCLMFYALKAGGENGTQRFPYGFFEVALSDTLFGSSTATLAYNIAAVAGTRANGGYTASGTPPSGCGSSVYNNNADVPVISAASAIMAAWYKADVLKPVYFNYAQPLTSTTYTWSNVGVSPCVGSFAIDYFTGAEFTVDYGTADFGVYSLSATADAELHGVATYPSVPTTTTEDTVVTLSAGATVLFNAERHISYGTAPSIGTSGTQNAAFSLWTTSVDGSTVYIAMNVDPTRFHPWAMGQPPLEMVRSDIADLNNAPQFFAKRAAANLILIGRTWIDKATLDRKTVIDRALTRNGAAAVAYPVPDNVTLGQISAAAQPVTGEIAIGADSAARGWV